LISNLLDDLGLDQAGKASFVESIRADLEVKQDDMFSEHQASKTALTIPSPTNRVNRSDEKFPLGNIIPLLNDAKRQIEGMVGARTDLKTDDSRPNSPIRNSAMGSTAETFDESNDSVTGMDNDAVPGVDFCLLPPRENK
jgi:hypothetical protein